MFFSIRCAIFPISWSQDSTGGIGIALFILLYCIASWIRLYYHSDGNKYKWLTGYITMAVCLLMTKMLIIEIGIGESLSSKFFGYSSPITILEAICLLLFFINLKPMGNKVSNVINYIAKHSFSVYIIHFDLMGVIFTKVFHIQNWINKTSTGIIAILISSTIIYFLCTIIDIIKCWFFNEIGKLMQQSKIKKCYLFFCRKWNSLVNEL